MTKGKRKSTTRLIDAANDMLRQENPMTVRQLFYRLVSAAVIDNCLSDHRRVSKTVTEARQDKRIPYAWIVDRKSRSNRRGSHG